MIPGCTNPDCPCESAQAQRSFGPGGCVERGPLFPSMEDHIRMVARRNLNDYAAQCHEDNMQWWLDLDTGEKLARNKGELLMLIVSEIAEAMEGVRKDSMDDKLPHRKMEEVELADALIRIFDYAGAHGLDIDGAYQEKRAYNAQRADHKPDARKAEGGKRF